ncbi:hypothetical protein [Cupriavidus numazuensis]|uniref:Uncharacterized protein n=1 Tax=Cupriavidus numazuensis TaxID=221992 RepID=A0ABN7Q332_9BURK|nr:hypothetical protein [Cupriavidus numazuensis]CAG2155320.1 hypothetical protein LMG26411_04882 [Cupriavidus numazuensis]
MDGGLKIGLTALALLAAAIYTAAQTLTMDMGVADVVAVLVRDGTDFLHRLFNP